MVEHFWVSRRCWFQSLAYPAIKDLWQEVLRNICLKSVLWSKEPQKEFAGPFALSLEVVRRGLTASRSPQKPRRGSETPLKKCTNQNCGSCTIWTMDTDVHNGGIFLMEEKLQLPNHGTCKRLYAASQIPSRGSWISPKGAATGEVASAQFHPVRNRLP